MSRQWRLVFWAVLAGIGLLSVACAPAARPSGLDPPPSPLPPSPAPGAVVSPFSLARTLSLDELHARALEEGGTLSLYSTLAQANAEKILPAFEKRFPGMKVDHVDATSDKLVARLVAEARGGKVLADILQTTMDYVSQVNRQGLLAQEVPPEAMAYPEELRGPYWVATDMLFIVAAWNTNLVRPDEVPRQFEDFADPRWKNRLIAERRDTEFLMGLALRKYQRDEPAVELLQRIAANNPEFHNGHSELAEYLASGQGAACITCFAHHFPSRVKRGAPVDYLLAEGVGLIQGTAVLKDAPHPYTAMLWHRWVHSEEGQQAYADAGRTPAHPNVSPSEKTRPEKTYALGADEVADTAKYERLWKEIFQLR